MKKGLFLLVFLLLPGLGSGWHPFYVSMTEIEYNSRERKLEISVRIFTDDLEKALAKECNCKTDLKISALKEPMKELVKTYLEKHLQLLPDGRALSFRFLGFENEEESTWSFLEADLPASPNHLTVKNNLLYRIQEKQSNLVRFKKEGFDKTIQLSYPDQEVRF